MKKLANLAIFLVALFATIIILGCSIYNYNIKSVSEDTTPKEFIVSEGSSFLTIASSLKENNLIRSELFYKIYVKIFEPKGLEAGPYNLNESMNVKEIIKVLSSGNTYNPDSINITFKEGINMRHIASIIASNTNNNEDDVYNLLKDTNYLDSLINKYWFITDDIKNDEIYYSLEGYLFPDTYSFNNKDVTVKEIFDTMLSKMNKELSIYKDEFDSDKYTIHEVLTMASIIELEAANSSDRKGVAGVFYNRLEDNWSLGSDVTTYYAEKLDMSERDLYLSELNDYNAYNTRSSKMAGILPVSPICSPSLESIIASLEPTNHDYYYFVADKNKKTYFSKTSSEHTTIVSKLKNEGLWYEY